MRIIRFICFMVSCLLSMPALSDDLSLNIDKKVISEGDVLHLTISYDGSSNENPDFSSILGDFQVISNSSSRQYSMINGVVNQIKKWTIPAGISLIVAGVAAFTIISLVPVNTGDAWYTMILCGAISIVAMILPGLSGSFLLLILGQYDRVWNAVGNIARLKFNSGEISMIVLLAIGCVAGLGAFVHLLNYLMKHFENVTIAALIGFGRSFL